ncbi:hypothetical protein [Paracraurococcus ruber]|uniref:Uncharacterized protein n=1 Tax=Paracraurococcus ruber TaxID=77675 RepID=A0ABS1CUA1_9PROT|nr:hypothetical protein [Paracraurococcus ruber]MBK1657928.1 hypothetical protein [Paracraurococcus ruber]TDG33119.1 hypothetical protein E2C05_05035 [Paracraurococcus ruber]
MDRILTGLNVMLGLMPGLRATADNSLQVVAFWLLLLVVPLFSLLAVVGVRTLVANRQKALDACYPDLAGSTYRRLFDGSRVKARPFDYVAPLLFLFALNFFLVVILVADAPTPEGLVDAKHYLMLCGPRCILPAQGEGVTPADVLAFRQYQTGTLVVVGFAFLGWICWALVTIFDRSTSLQILPSTFRKITIRLALAVLVAVTLRHGLPDVSVALIGFGVGMFPQRGIAWLEGAFNRLIQAEQRSEAFALELVQGISRGVTFRLQEVGIDDAVDLAHANPFLLYDSSGYQMSEIVDWIAQAQLLVLAQSEAFQALQRDGIRTVFDVMRRLAGPSPGPLPGTPAAGLTRDLIPGRPEYERLAEVYRAIGGTLP